MANRPRYRLGWDGEVIEDLTTLTEGMTYPVQCSHCHGIYDLGKVTVTARYTDCSMWKSPCCGLTVDDRSAGWKSRPDYTEA